MRRCFFAGFLLMMFSLNASAVNISVSVNDTSIVLGESVLLHLEVNTTEPIGGQFVLYEEAEPKKYVLVRIYADFPDCAVCGGEIPLSRPHSADYLFKPLSAGTYMAEAAFGGKAERVFFNVSRRTTTTTTRATTTSTTSISTTTSSTTTTGVVANTTTTLLGGQQYQKQNLGSLNIILPLLAAVILLGAVYLKLKKII